MRKTKKISLFLISIITHFLLCTPTVFSREKTNIILIMPSVLATQTSIARQSDWWEPKPGISWQWQLNGTIDTSLDVKMYDIDYENSAAIIDVLHKQGKTVICYMSAGSWEIYRSDASQYPSLILGNTLYGWPDEKWVDIRRLDQLGPILEARMDAALAKGCDGIEPDNVDAYQNNSGFPISYQDQITFNKWLAQKAHERKLSVGLKNDLGQVADLEPFFDWALNEECFQNNECEALLPFINADKAVFGVEYMGDPNIFCPEANKKNFDWLKKNLELDAWRHACR